MKKLLFLSLLFCAVISTTNAQVGGGAGATPQQPKQQMDPAAVLQQMKERFKPQMIEKTGLTEAQADKVIELNFEMRMAAGALSKDLSEADRSAKIAELKAAKEKKMNALLTPDQIKAVAAFYEDMGKNAPKKPSN